MESVIENWGSVQNPLSAAQAKSWLKLADQTLAAGGVLALDPRDGDHAAHIEARLGDDTHLAAYFPRKASMMKATAAAFDANDGPLESTLLQMTPAEAGIARPHPFIAVPHLAFHPSANAVVATGVVSHPKLLHALELILEVVDADSGKLVGATSLPPTFGTHYQRATVTAPLAGDTKPRRLVAGLTANYVVDGQPHATPMFAAAAVDSVSAIQMVTPFAPLPVKHPGATQVTITIARNDPTFDYCYYPAPAPNEIIVPFSGQAQLAQGYSMVSATPCQTGSLVLAAQGYFGGGGGAHYALAQSDVIAAFAASEGAIATWSMGPDWQQQFGTAAGTGTFDIMLQATLNVTAGGVQNTTQLTVSSYGPVSPGGQLLPLYIQWGCVAPWTMVRMADGSERAIAHLRAGDLVAAGDGRTAEVDRVITGEEIEPMWRLAAGGRELLATHDHPVLTPTGPVAIARLAPGDMIVTSSGPAPVERIAAEDYAGGVVNLVLRAPGGAIPLRGDCFVGEGVLIGDNCMQNALASYAPAPALPPEWAVDAENALRLAAGLPLVAAA